MFLQSFSSYLTLIYLEVLENSLFSNLGYRGKDCYKKSTLRYLSQGSPHRITGALNSLRVGGMVY